MVYSLAYRRPERVSRNSFASSSSGESKQKSIHDSVRSGSSGMSHGIPEALSFDRIIAGGVCPVSLSYYAMSQLIGAQPCTVRDFMNFLKYIELSAENLQFYLWFRDYSKRFEELPGGEKALSPKWTGDNNNGNGEVRIGPKANKTEATVIFKGTEFASDPKIDEYEKTGSNPFFTPPRTPTSLGPRDGGESFDTCEDSLATAKLDHTRRADCAFEGAGLKWKPCEFC
jgi:hypothetical protein